MVISCCCCCFVTLDLTLLICVKWTESEDEQKVFVPPRTNVSYLRLICLLGNQMDKMEAHRDHTSLLMSFIGIFHNPTSFSTSHNLWRICVSFLRRMCYIMATRIVCILYHSHIIYKGFECNIFYYIACSLNINRTDLTGLIFCSHWKCSFILKFMEFYCIE